MSQKSHSPDAWQRLCRMAARSETTASEIPFGFSTRMASRLATRSIRLVSLTSEQLAWRGALAAGIIALAALVFDYKLLSDLWSGDTLLAGSLVELIYTP